MRPSARDLVLFSPVEGRVLAQGAPVPGVRVEREAVFGWTRERIVDAVLTDADGRFAFDALLRRNWLARWLPHQPNVRQTLTLAHAGRTWAAWQYHKSNYRLHGECEGRPLRLLCRLEAPQAHSGEMYGIARFDDPPSTTTTQASA